MNIAFLIPSLANKGPIIVAHDLVHALMKYPDIHIVVFYLDETKELEFACETRHITSPLKMDFSEFDIVHSHMMRPDIFSVLNRRKHKATKLVATIHSYMEKDLRNNYGATFAFFARRIWCFMLNRMDKVVCLSNDMLKYYSKFIRPSRLTYIYNGRCLGPGSPLPVPESAAIEAMRSKYKMIGGIAVLTKIKGFEQLVSILPDNPEFALMIIGDGPEKEPLINLATELGVLDRCMFLGYKKNATDYFKYFDIYAMTSYSEGFPLVLQEAANFGKPTICSDLAIFKEIFTPDEVCFYHLYDLKDLSRALHQAINNAGQLSENINKKFNAAYTAEIMGQRYLELYRGLMTGK